MTILGHACGGDGTSMRGCVTTAGWLLVLSGLFQPHAHAQVALNGDSRITTLQVRPGQPIVLTVVAGVDQTVILPQGEHILRVIVGEAGAFHVAVPTGQDALVISAMRPVSATALQVQTPRQRYEFTVEAVLQGQVPLVVRLMGGEQLPTPQAQTAPPRSADSVVTEYRITGDEAVRPASISDDGSKTSIQWSAAQAIPAVFSLDAKGKEQMVNGFMRGGSFVIDRVFDKLVFRIDSAVAQAKRLPIATQRP